MRRSLESDADDGGVGGAREGRHHTGRGAGDQITGVDRSGGRQLVDATGEHGHIRAGRRGERGDTQYGGRGPEDGATVSSPDTMSTWPAVTSADVVRLYALPGSWMGRNPLPYQASFPNSDA